MCLSKGRTPKLRRLCLGSVVVVVVAKKRERTVDDRCGRRKGDECSKPALSCLLRVVELRGEAFIVKSKG